LPPHLFAYRPFLAAAAAAVAVIAVKFGNQYRLRGNKFFQPIPCYCCCCFGWTCALFPNQLLN
jgi:hypothetical protein